MNWELPDVQAGFRKGRGTRDQIANIHWITEKAREFQKNICFTDWAKAFDRVDHKKLWKKNSDHLTSFLRNLYADQEATVRTGHGNGLVQNWERSMSWLYIVTLPLNIYTNCVWRMWKRERERVTQSCLTLCDPMDCSPPGSSAHGILQARILEWVTIPFFRGSSWPKDQTCISCIAGRFFTI